MNQDFTAVVLAGGRRKILFRELFHQIEDLLCYGEWYFQRGYKSLRRILLRGSPIARPMLEYTLDTLMAVERIEKIIIVGPQKEINERLHIGHPDSRVEVIGQEGSFGKNALAGYRHSGKKHVLFSTSDTPTTTPDDIEEFLSICSELGDRYDMVYPVVKKSYLDRYMSAFPRKCFYMVPDSIYPPDYIDESDLKRNNRAGFRISSLAYADLSECSARTIDNAFDSRKLLSRRSRKMLKSILGSGIIKRYSEGFLMSEIEEIVKRETGVSTKFVGLRSAGTSLDIDSSRDERGIYLV